MNTRLFRRLHIKFVAISMCLLVILMIAVCVTVYLAMAQSLKANSKEVLDYTAELLSSEVYDDQFNASSSNSTDSSASPASESPAVPERPQMFDAMLFTNVLIVYHDDFGYITKVVQNDRFVRHIDILGNRIPEFSQIKQEREGIVTISDTSYRYKHITVKEQPILLLLSREGELANLPPLMNILLSVGIGSIIILFFVCFFLAKSVIRPISDAWNVQQQFLHDASHELKTPIAVITTNLDAVRACPEETVASQDRWLQYAAEEAEDMRKLVNDMLALAINERPHSEERAKPFVPFSLSETVTEAGLINEANALEAGIELVLDVEENLWTVGHRDGIKRVIMILLDNALKNTFAGGKITLELHHVRNDLLVSCTNTGHGIPKEELQNIFKRFYRLDSSRARQSGGTGLGLSIAEGAIKRHGGKIWAESEVGSYARFIFKLSATQAPQEE